MKEKLIPIFMSALLAAGCSSIPGALPGAEQVKTSSKAPPATCKKLTNITAQQSGQMMTAQELQRGAMNQIRNAAFKQEANYLQITADYSETAENSLSNKAMSSVVIKGIAYQCPASVLQAGSAEN